jgi:hypothetical protein
MSKVTVDNSGQGNCMYYAYSISLMYHLLRIKDKEAAERVFNKLELSDIQKRQLHALLENKQLTRFTDKQITNIIEPILGVATRKISAEKTTEQFINNPKSSPLYTATNYGMVYLFRKEFEKQSSELGALLRDNDFDNPDYTNSEIYRLYPARSNSELGKFVASQYKDIIKEFNQGWAARVEMVFEAKKTDKVKKTKEQIAADPFYKQQFLEELIGKKTEQFFTDKNNQHLKEYEAHLNTNYRWGSEETLLLLHRHVTGERQVNVGTKDDVYWEFQYDTDIKLVLCTDGVPKSGDASVHADMVLNNLGNIHWVSLVEPVVLNPVLKKDKVSPTVKVDPIVTVDSIVTVDPIVTDSVVTFDTHHVDHIADIDTSLIVEQSNTESREDLLEICGFNLYLQELEAKAAELVEVDFLAATEAFAIVEQLTDVKKRFINTESTTMTDKKFSEECQGIITNAPKDNLKNHRGAGIILNGLLNAAITIANLFIKLANLVGKFELIDHDRIATKSIQQVSNLNTSLSALTAMRAREDKKHIEEHHPTSPSSDSEPPSLA